MIGFNDDVALQDALFYNTPDAWEERKEPALKFIRKTGIESYKDELPKHVAEMIVNECGDVMERLGYSTG